MDVTWRKSSYSGGNGGNCIEVSAPAEADRVLVRDARDRQGTTLAFSALTWRRFAERVKKDAPRLS
jgi:Domain of unknown function (DUF397)